jgi:hypothetical protein
LNGKLAADEGHAILAASEATQGIKGARTVRLVEVREAENCLLTEMVSSQTNLFNHLWASAALTRFLRHGWSHQRLAISGHSLGAWLHAYHTGTTLMDCDATEAHLAIARQSWARIKAINSMAPRLLRQSLADSLGQRLTTLERASTTPSNALCAIHGDLNLSNVLVEKGTNDLVIIDFGNGRKGLGIEDVATVYCTILAMRTVRGRSARGLDGFLAGLLDAYGPSASALNPMWHLMQIMCYLRLVLSYIDFKKRLRFSWLSERAYWQITRGSLQLLANECPT